MDTLTQKYQISQQLIDNFDEGKDAFTSIRAKAFSKFQQLGLPSSKNEEYKYTPISKALNKHFDQELSVTDSNLTFEDIESILPKNTDVNLLCFINGQYSENHSVIKPQKGVTITGFNQANSSDTEFITNQISALSAKDQDPFYLLNSASINNGLSIKIEAGSSIGLPFLILYLSDTKSEKTFSQPRTLVVAEENSQFSLMESFVTIGDHTSFNNAVTEIVLKDNCIATYTKIGSENNQAYHVGNTRVFQEKSSVFSATSINLSGTMVRNNLDISQNGSDCESNMYGLYMLTGKQHVDNHTTVDHRKPNSFSNELYKGILDESSTGVFNGKIFVRPDAQKTNAFQSNKNILLTDSASVNTKPQLEIWADDVKCSHGCTTGQLDNEQIFYLRSRGIDYNSARAMVLYAFAMDILNKITNLPAREYLDSVISKRLQHEFD